SENKIQLEKLKLPELTEEDIITFINKPFEGIQPQDVYQDLKFCQEPNCDACLPE
ncbi:11390_t:CDS:2, partial [Racocetra persica]